MRTADGGCSWQHAYTLGEQEGETYTVGNASILEVEVPESGGRVLLSIAETVAAATRPHILFSNNAGRSWQSGDQGLPPLGSPEALVVAPSSPDTAYLGIDLGGGIPIDSFWASTDGGLTWEARDQHPGGEFTGFEVDPLVPTEVWSYGEGLHKSTNGGATWTPIEEFVGIGTGPVDVFHARGQASSLFVFIPEERIVQKSDDGGETWLQVYGLSDPDSIDHGATSESRVATSGGHAFVWAPSLFQWVDAQAPRSGVTDVNGPTSDNPVFVMHNGTSILVFGGQTGTGLDIDRDEFDIGDISLPPDSDPVTELDPPGIAPKDHVVKIPAGETKRVRYDVSLSKIRTPLDLYFLIDTSESAKPFLEGLARVLDQLVTELEAARLDVDYGLAEYRAYPDSTPPRPDCADEDLPLVENAACERNFVYRQVLDLPNSSTQALELAIEGLVPIAGGHYNAQLPALQQVATGSGVDVWPEGMSSSHVDGNDVQPGQDASYREKALRVVLNATDEHFSTGQPYDNDDFPPDIPSFAEVTASLNERDIHQIGLALGTAALDDLRTVARDTFATAPAGADCDGDGVREIGPGQPLVCVARQSGLEQGSNLVPAIVNMVEAVRDREPVALEVSSKNDVVDSVTPEEYPGVALQVDKDLKFDVTYRCPRTLAGTRNEVDLAATQSGGVIVDTTATIVCGKVPEDFFAAFRFDRVLALALLPLTPPPTIVNTGQATQAQSQAQAQGALAAQEQEQPQVALVTQYRAAVKEALAKEDEYFMTRYQERTAPSVPPGLFLGGAGLLMGAAYALAMSRRRRVAPAYTRRR